MNRPDHPASPLRPIAPPQPPAAAGRPLRALLLVADAAKLLELRGLLRQRWPDCRIEEDRDPVDALLRAVRMPADLVLVDAALSIGPPAMLARHLGRVAPAVSMLVFDERPAASEQPLVSCWSEVAARLDRWALDAPLRPQGH